MKSQIEANPPKNLKTRKNILGYRPWSDFKSEKKRIWTDEYMKVVKLNTYPHAFKEKYDAKFEILNQIKGEKNE